MKKLLLLSLLTLFCMLLFACREAPNDDPIDLVQSGSIDNVAFLQDVTTITLGGFFISDEMRRAVVEFNKENEGVQITIRDYWDEIGGDWYAASLRFRTEIVTGGGPDIIYQPGVALSDGGFLVDLYPLIDADNELSRTDFFSNALKALEASDGSLTTVADSFWISSMYGLPDVVGHISQDSWTTQRMLALLKDHEGMFAPFGQWVDRVDFIRTMLQSSGDDLINRSSGEAYLNSEEFINILEAAAFLPSSEEIMGVYQGMYAGDYAKLLLGERLLLTMRIRSPVDYRLIVYDDVNILGVPTFEGGKNILHPGEGVLGINASSKYVDDAWLFVRQLLVHSVDTETTEISDKIRKSFPIRIDMYDELIDSAMTQIIDEEGEEVPHFWVDDPTLLYSMTHDEEDLSIPFYDMTQKEADDLCLIIESAVPQSQRIEDELWVHLVDDLNTFFAGHRSAHDTARIMQNRVQTYLNERS